MEQHAAQRVLPAGRGAVDADARDVVPRIFRRDRLVPEDAIGEAGVAQILPRDIVECLRAIAGAHAVDLDDDEARVRPAPALRGTALNVLGTNEPCGPA